MLKLRKVSTTPSYLVDVRLSDINIFSNQNFEDFNYSYIFRYREDTYVYDRQANSYKLLAFDARQRFSELRVRTGGLAKDEHRRLKKLFGSCTMEISTAPWYIMMFKDSVNFFYLFQIYGIIAWMLDEMYAYSVMIFIMMSYSIIGELVDIRENLNRLQRMAHYECPVRVRRADENGNSYFREIMSGDLVPGDVFAVPERCVFPCDALLVSGEAVINEAMLTGESTASHKIEIPNDNNLLNEFDILNSEQIKHFCFSGTSVIKCGSNNNNETLAMAINTGFSSIKGRLIKSILYRTPERFKFHQEIKMYLVILFVLAILALLTSLPVMVKYLNVSNIILNWCNGLTFAVPAELPVAMSVGIIFALKRLKNVKISCVNVSRINVSGRVSTMVFDKTGTLTENGISVVGIKVFNGRKFERRVKIDNNYSNFVICEKECKIWIDSSMYKRLLNDSRTKYVECMVCCHSLINLNNSLIGDPLESEMFKVTKWTFDEQLHQNSNKKSLVFRPHNSEFRLKQLHQFDFLPDLQRMSVVVQNNFDSNCVLYVKGSPEKVFELCDKRSMPADYFDVLKKYTEAGKRVIAFAFRQLAEFDESQADRADLERELIFVGFLIFLNKLKPESTISIDKLKKGNVTTMMATGDNLLTGIAMARACKILTSDAVVTIDLDPQTKDITFKHKKLRLDVEIRDSVASAERKSELSDVEEEAKLLDYDLKPRESMSSTRSLEIGSLFDMMQGEHADTEIAVTGSAFESLVDLRSDNQSIDAYRARDIGTIIGLLLYSSFKRVLVGARVYARMSPDQKAMLVKELQDETGENVGMCGDGANDCKALKVADVGLSLSEAEASIAAPFTSNVQNISSSVELLKLGRFSLDISYSLIQVMFMYTCIQFTCLIFTYYFASKISDFQYVYVDICCLMPITLFICWIDPKPELIEFYPPNSLLDPRVFISIIGHMIVTISGIIGIYFCLIHQSFYIPIVKSAANKSDNQEVTTMFLFTLPLYIFVGVVSFSTSKFKESIFKKFSFEYFIITSYLIIQICVTYWIILYPPKFMKDLLDLVNLDMSFRIILASSTVGIFILYMAYEHFLFIILNRFIPQKTKRVRKAFKRQNLKID